MPGRMPVLFSAHGSPMNAIRDNAFTKFLGRWAAEVPRPRAVLAVSAHWETEDPTLTTSERPRTIHDFYGFPRELYVLRYPAPGDPALAARAAAVLSAAGFDVREDPRQGLDHGVWSPLRRIFPAADLPVVQLGLLHGEPLGRHVEVGRAIRPLRDEGVLIFCSGNLVHNLAEADLGSDDVRVEPWAAEFDAWAASRLRAGDVEALASFRDSAPHGRRAHPTIEHYAPLLVAVGAAGAAGDGAAVSFPYEGFEHATIGMRCVTFA